MSTFIHSWKVPAPISKSSFKRDLPSLRIRTMATTIHRKSIVTPMRHRPHNYKETRIPNIGCRNWMRTEWGANCRATIRSSKLITKLPMRIWIWIKYNLVWLDCREKTWVCWRCFLISQNVNVSMFILQQVDHIPASRLSLLQQKLAQYKQN